MVRCSNTCIRFQDQVEHTLKLANRMQGRHLLENNGHHPACPAEKARARIRLKQPLLPEGSGRVNWWRRFIRTVHCLCCITPPEQTQ